MSEGGEIPFLVSEGVPPIPALPLLALQPRAKSQDLAIPAPWYRLGMQIPRLEGVGGLGLPGGGGAGGRRPGVCGLNQ